MSAQGPIRTNDTVHRGEGNVIEEVCLPSGQLETLAGTARWVWFEIYQCVLITNIWYALVSAVGMVRVANVSVFWCDDTITQGPGVLYAFPSSVNVRICASVNHHGECLKFTAPMHRKLDRITEPKQEVQRPCHFVVSCWLQLKDDILSSVPSCSSYDRSGNINALAAADKPNTEEYLTVWV